MKTLTRNLEISKIKGFTLVELAIVLVIIGLIVGGVLVGRDLIKQAEIRSQIKEVDALKSAVLSFQLKYNCLPGDCKNATQFLTGATEPDKVVNGDGNGLIQGYCNRGSSDCNTVSINFGWPNDQWAEWYNVYDHLAAAGMTGFPTYDETTAGLGVDQAYPALKIKSPGGGSGVCSSAVPGGMVLGYLPAYQYISAGHKILLGWAAIGAGQCSGINPSEASVIDTKIDDGKPYSGAASLLGTSGYVFRIPGSGADNTGYCGNSATGTYYNDTDNIIAGVSPPRLRLCYLNINAF